MNQKGSVLWRSTGSRFARFTSTRTQSSGHQPLLGWAIWSNVFWMKPSSLLICLFGSFQFGYFLLVCWWFDQIWNGSVSLRSDHTHAIMIESISVLVIWSDLKMVWSVCGLTSLRSGYTVCYGQTDWSNSEVFYF